LIVGNNGAGKTNLLRALQYLLCGDPGGVCNRDENICQLVDTGAPSHVSGTLLHNGNTFELLRSLRPAKQQLRAGGRTYTGATEINKVLFEQLGVTKKQLDDYVFVRQRAVDALIDKAPAERGAELAALFGADRGQKVYDAVGKFLRGITIPATLDSPAALRALLDITDKQIADTTLELQKFADIPDDPQRYQAELFGVFEDWRALVQQRRMISRNKRELVRIGRKRGLHHAAYTRTMGERDEVKEALDTLAALMPDVQRDLQAWNTLHNNKEVIARLARQKTEVLADFRCRPQMRPKPDGYPLPATRDKWRETVIALRGEVAGIERTLRDLGDSTKTTCEACGQPLPRDAGKEHQQQRLAEELVSKRKPLVELSARLAEVDAYDAKRKIALDARRELKQQCREVKAGLRSVANVKQPARSLDDLHALVREHSLYSAAYTDLNVQSQVGQQELSVFDNRIETLTQNVAQYTLELCKRKAVRRHEARVARRKANELLTALDQRGKLRAALASLQKEREHLLQRMQAAARVVRTAEATQKVVAHLENVRQIFHTSEAPRAVSFTYLEMLQDTINELLALFEAPFVVAPDDSFGFQATFTDDGRVMSDRRLSVGERIVLSMAFRVAVNSMLAGSLGLLVMDEPTAGLDEHNLDCLPRALDNLRRLSEERGLQVLFVTHEPRVMQHFDHVITL
jgi:DNA repair exonuclease SbcCD ATPase subunit